MNAAQPTNQHASGKLTIREKRAFSLSHLPRGATPQAIFLQIIGPIWGTLWRLSARVCNRELFAVLGVPIRGSGDFARRGRPEDHDAVVMAWEVGLTLQPSKSQRRRIRVLNAIRIGWCILSASPLSHNHVCLRS